MKKFFLFFFLLLFCFFLFHPAALAKTLEFSPNVSLGPFKVGSSQRVYGNFSLLKKYIIAVYRFIIGLSAILAVIVIAIGGIIWATAAGSAGQVSKAKGLITGSLFGLVLTLLSYSLLSAINSDITNLDFQGAMVKKIKNTPAPGCQWQNNKCDLDYQTDYTQEGNMYCSAQKTGNYCCCVDKGVDKAKKACKQMDMYFGGMVDFGGATENEGNQAEYMRKCQVTCQNNPGLFFDQNVNSFEIIPIAGGERSGLCCSCSKLCESNKDCIGGFTCQPVSSGSAKICLPCLKSGEECSSNGECCSNVCLEKTGWFSSSRRCR